MTEFVHLHVHSDNSLQDAAVSVMALADRAEKLKMEYLALTDHGNMFGAMEFIAACGETLDDKGKHIRRKNPIHPIIGCEAYVSPGSRLEKTGSEGENKYFHLVLLASSREGYFNLVKLCSYAYMEGFYYRPRIDDGLLSQYKKGLIALSACVSGEIPWLIQIGKIEEAEKKALFYRDLFGNDESGNPNFYLEIQDHGIPAGVLKGASISQRQVNDEVIAISRKTGIPLVATNDIHYLNQEDSVAHDILLCIGTGKTRTEEKRKKYYGDQFYFKSAEEMAALFSAWPDALSNTIAIARRCSATIPKVKPKDLPHYLPEFEIPPGFTTADDYLRHLTAEGLHRRYCHEKENAEQNAETSSVWEVLRQRTQYELNVIIQMGFTGYFLIVADFINWAKDKGIDVGPGRGSGAGSIVAYVLRITDIEPTKYGLLFERFLNPERISMPDFDIDFCNERREEVIAYVTEKYGKERVGQIITFGTLGAKAVIKDVARALSISIPESDAISKLIPFGPKVTLAKALKDEPKLNDIAEDARYTELFALARKLEGLKRHSSIHAAGIVIGKNALTNYVPLYRDPKTGGTATQYTMNYLENCGLVKMDFLGLKTLDVIKHTEELIRRRGPEYEDFSVAAVPEEDKAVFAMLGEGKSFGVFQFESEGMQNTLRQAKPGKIEDLIALNALYRPGPMANINQYIESKNGKRKISYPLPSLENILKETYGVIVYQEQVMQVARIVAGYSMGQADLLRRAMGKKKKEIIEKEKIPFLAGAAQQGYSAADAGRIYDMLIPFADYGFNKSHAAAYSVIAYRTAYLKVNFPAEFMAANLSNEIHSANKDKLSECIGEGRKIGLAIDPPDINRSDKLFAVVDGRIVFGFLGIKGVGSAPAEEIIQKRQDGPYKSFMDFLDRVTLQNGQANQHIVSRKVIELLIKTGAFDGFGINRTTMLTSMEAAIEHAQNKKNEIRFGQVRLFEDMGEETIPDFVFPQMPEMDRMEQLTIERELIGFYFSGHPLDNYRELWERCVKLDTSNLDNVAPGNYVLIGILKSLKSLTDKTGKAMAFGTLEDYRGEIDLAFFGDVWGSYRDKLKLNDIIAIKGRVDLRRGGKASLQAVTVFSSAELNERKIAELDTSGHSPNSAMTRNMDILDKYREVWEQNMTLDLSAPQEGVENHILVGVLSSIRTHLTKNQKEMAFGTLEDYRGRMDLVFFDRCWEINRDKLIEKTCIALKGKLDLSRDRPSFLVSSVQDLGRMRRAAKTDVPTAQIAPVEQTAQAAPSNGKPTVQSSASPPPEKISPAMPPSQEVHIRLCRSAMGNEKSLYPLRDYLIEHPGTVPVFIHVPAVQVTASYMSAETIIRTAVQLSITADQKQLARLGENPIVEEVWVA
jgi:DNA polymerase-3 subunit alpha